MEHKGLVARVAEDLERSIALSQLPEDGMLPSEQTLARRYGVSRSTIRGALQGLVARGLVVQHPGRRSRAVAVDEALTLESLRLVLPAEGKDAHARRRLLEGFFALKREVTVELLAACCEHASPQELALLGDGCFALGEETRWQEDRRGGWLQREFELLRLAARTANRPGHVLLIQSLERSLWGMAEWVLPHLQAGAIYSWAVCAMHALGQRDGQALRQELPALLQAADEGLLGRLAPMREEHASPEPSLPSVKEPPSHAACENLSDRRTGLGQTRPTEAGPSQSVPAHASPPSDRGSPTCSPAPHLASEFPGSSTPEGVPTPAPTVPARTAAPGWPGSSSTPVLSTPLIGRGVDAASSGSEQGWPPPD